MDDIDFRKLIKIVEGELRVSGLEEIADPAMYITTDPKTGDVGLLEPQTRLKEMLQAFDRAIAVRDRGTYEKAMRSLNNNLQDSKITGVVYLPASDQGDREEISLSKAPDLNETQKDLRVFIQHLFGLGPEPEPGPQKTVGPKP